MKVVCISCFDYYDTRMFWVIKYFRKKGFETRYLITDFDHFSKTNAVRNYPDSKQLHVPAYFKNLSLRRLMSHYIFSKSVVKELKIEKPDIIYCVVPPNSLVKGVAGYKRKNPDCKVVFDIYDMWPESFPYAKNNPVLNIFFNLWRKLRDKYICSADILTGVSRHQKEELDAMYHMDTKVIFPRIADEESVIPSYSFDIDGGISFLYLGNINHITDIELGTELLAGIAESTEVTLHIIGEGQNRDTWVQMLNAAGVKTICYGAVFDAEKKREIFGKCQLGLNIPRQAINSSMALKSVEYMHLGLPFVNSGTGDNKEIAEKENLGINIDRDNLSDTIERIKNLSCDDLIKMHQNSINFYKSAFSEQDYDSIFDEILHR